jgi:AraC family ethanolamine operon transcriptional activator
MSSSLNHERHARPDHKKPGNLVVHSLQTHDFDQLALAFHRWNLQFRQLSSGPFDGELHFAQAGGIQVVQVTVNQVVQARGGQVPGSYGFVPITTTNAEALWRGTKQQPGQIVVHGPGQEIDHRTSRAYSTTLVSVDAELLRSVFATLQGFELEETLAKRLAIATAPATSSGLLARLQNVLNRLLAQPGLPAQPFAQRMFEVECARWLVQAIGTPEAFSRPDTRSANRRLVVRRVDDYMQANIHEPLTILDFCKEGHASERTLHYAFHEVFGMSPMAYFKAQRLNCVRQALKTAEFADDRTVAEIAQHWGFWHTGNFAADYRRLFGELPSQTFVSGRR